MKRVYLATIVLAALALGGCKTTSGGSGACIALAAHFPQIASRLDTMSTKEAAYYRNVAYASACPEHMPKIAKLVKSRKTKRR